MNLIVDGLFLGGLSDAKNTDRLLLENISHILTLDVKPISDEKKDKFIYKFIEIEDVDESNIILHFEDCNDFIDEGRSNGGILVHCFVGLSRSATIVIAYMMNKFKLSYNEGFKTVRAKRGDIWPNEGFRKQLQIYEAMGCCIDVNHPAYKKLKMSELVSLYNSGEIPIELLSEDPNSEDSESLDVAEEEKSLYRCKKCRRALFDTSAKMWHDKGKCSSVFDWTKFKSNGKSSAPVKCMESLFIEPVKWMADSITVIQGKLTCPKCKTKIGSFSWVGEKCVCGSHITPAFQIQTKKVETLSHEPVPVLRLPPSLENTDQVGVTANKL